jgi:IclR family transcriptional regulator, acetate operon repressor
MGNRGSERILDLVEWLADQPEPAALSETAQALALPKSSTLLLLRILVAGGYAERNPDGYYRLVRLPGEPSPTTSAWGTIRRVSEPILAQAIAEVRESGFIAVLTPDNQIRYLNKILPDLEIRYDRNISKLRMPHQVASGIVCLAGLPSAALREYLATLDPLAINATDRPKQVLRSIGQAKTDGYFVNLKGVVDGAAGVSAPIFGDRGQVVAAVNIAGPRDRIASNRDEIVAAAIKAADRVSKRLARDIVPVTRRNQTNKLPRSGDPSLRKMRDAAEARSRVREVRMKKVL